MLNLPNTLSLSRALAGPFIYSWILQGQVKRKLTEQQLCLEQPCSSSSYEFYFDRSQQEMAYMQWEVVLPAIGVAAITDWLDGVAARKLNQHSVLGSYLDPVADKILIGCVTLGMAKVVRHICSACFYLRTHSRNDPLSTKIPGLTATAACGGHCWTGCRSRYRRHCHARPLFEMALARLCRVLQTWRRRPSGSVHGSPPHFKGKHLLAAHSGRGLRSAWGDTWLLSTPRPALRPGSHDCRDNHLVGCSLPSRLFGSYHWVGGQGCESTAQRRQDTPVADGEE